MFCKQCGSENANNAKFCSKCGVAIAPQVIVQDTGCNTSNNRAVLAYYSGIVGLVFPILAIVAVILGFLGIGYAQQNPHAKGTAHAIIGMILGCVSIIFWSYLFSQMSF